MIDEKQLVQSLKDGDQGAFELLVRLYFRSAYGVAFRYMKDHGGADDVVQESFMKALKAIDSFRGDASFKSWLLRIVSNTALNVLRSQKYKSQIDVEDVELPFINKDYGNVEQKQTANLLKLAIGKLPEKQRQALELRIYEDMSFKEVAEVMDSPFDTAKANYRHAIMNLRKFLDSAEGKNDWAELKLAFEGLLEEEGYEPQ